MGRSISIAATSWLLPAMRAFFGLTQAEAGRLLGATQNHVSRAETGLGLLPAQAWPRLRALQAASQAAAAPLPAPDLAPLRARLAQCQAQAQRLALRLAHELPPRAAAARARLEATEALPAALAAAETEAPLPPRAREDQLGQLTLLLNHARAEWDERSGPVPSALLRARLAALHAEAQILADELTKIADELAG